MSSSGAATLNSLSLTTALGKSYGGTGLTSAGTAGNVLTSDGTNWTSVAKITSGTAIATTSGISALFTGIPANVKRITIMFNGFGTNGSSVPWVQIGSGSLSTTGYSALTQAYAGTNTSTTTSTSGFYLSNSNGSSYAWSGAIVLYTLGSNVWVASGFVGSTVGTYSGSVSGSITLGGALDRVSIAASNGTDTLRAGSINILYE